MCEDRPHVNLYGGCNGSSSKDSTPGVGKTIASCNSLRYVEDSSTVTRALIESRMKPSLSSGKKSKEENLLIEGYLSTDRRERGMDRNWQDRGYRAILGGEIVSKK